MYACITRETFVFTVFRRVFHLILKLELCRHACRRRDQIIPTCRYGKNMPTTALVITHIYMFYKCAKGSTEQILTKISLLLWNCLKLDTLIINKNHIFFSIWIEIDQLLPCIIFLAGTFLVRFFVCLFFQENLLSMFASWESSKDLKCLLAVYWR